MPIWLVVVIAIGCYSLGCGFGLFLAILGVISRERKAVHDGYIEIDGTTYLLGEIVKKGDFNR